MTLGFGGFIMQAYLRNGYYGIFKERFMNKYYVQCALYAYMNIESVINQIDDQVERLALGSFNDHSSCLEQCERIVGHTIEKVTLMDIKEKTDKVLKGLTAYELDCLDYKYFKITPKEYFEEIGFDFLSRKYFRKQVNLLNKLSNLFDKVGASDEWFEKKCLNVDFIKRLLKRVKLLSLKRRKSA